MGRKYIRQVGPDGLPTFVPDDRPVRSPRKQIRYRLPERKPRVKHARLPREKRKIRISLPSVIAWGVTVPCIACLSYLSLQKSTIHNNWDLAAYVGLVYKNRGYADTELRTLTYSTLKKELPSEDYKRITGNGYSNSYSSSFMRLCSKDDQVFVAQLRFYETRQFFVFLVDYLNHFHLPFTTCFLVLTLGPCIAILGAFAFIFADSGRLFLCILGPPLVLYALVAAQIPFMRTTDALCMGLCVPGIIWILRGKHPLSGVILLLLSILFKLDMASTVMLFCFGMLFIDKTKRNRIVLSMGVACSVAVFMLISTLSHPYPYSVLLYHSLIRSLPHPESTSVAWTYGNHLSAIQGNWEVFLNALIPSLIFCALALVIWPFFRGASKHRSLLLISVALLSSIARFIIYPHVETRYYVSATLIALISLAYMVSAANVSRIQLAQQPLEDAEDMRTLETPTAT